MFSFKGMSKGEYYSFAPVEAKKFCFTSRNVITKLLAFFPRVILVYLQ